MENIATNIIILAPLNFIDESVQEELRKVIVERLQVAG